MNIDTVIASRYKIKGYIGKGGMQDVYLAEDLVLGINVAVKKPLSGQIEKRFFKSAKIAAKINHHNVAKTLDYIEENGSQYLIEEFVEGDTLESKIKRYGLIDPHLAARVFYHLAKGVAASHHAGVIHRDLKPSNIIAEPGVNLHTLKITDFGIATLTEEVFEFEAKEGDLTRSTSGTIKGAIPYMAPEMMFREPGDYPGKEVDIWSLGALVFRLSTGKYPFGLFLHAAVNVKNKNREPWPNFMTAKEQYKYLALDIQRIVESCLEYNPSNRPTADELVSSISELCYINMERSEGLVGNIIQNGRSGFANQGESEVFFSMESVYGNVNEIKKNETVVCYSKFPGNPKPRAHPIIIVNESL